MRWWIFLVANEIDNNCRCHRSRCLWGAATNAIVSTGTNTLNVLKIFTRIRARTVTQARQRLPKGDDGRHASVRTRVRGEPPGLVEAVRRIERPKLCLSCTFVYLALLSYLELCMPLGHSQSIEPVHTFLGCSALGGLRKVQFDLFLRGGGVLRIWWLLSLLLRRRACDAAYSDDTCSLGKLPFMAPPGLDPRVTHTAHSSEKSSFRLLRFRMSLVRSFDSPRSHKLGKLAPFMPEVHADAVLILEDDAKLKPG